MCRTYAVSQRPLPNAHRPTRTGTVCILFAAALLLCLLPPRARALAQVNFTSVNDSLLDLTDSTMPFWYSGKLYVPYTVVYGTSLGISYSNKPGSSVIVLYKERRSLTFDLENGIATSNSGEAYASRIITRDGVVFFPTDILCAFFDLDCSYTRISYGYLVRLKSDAVVQSDAVFIDAAESAMAIRYARYERAHAPAPEPAAQPEEPPAPSAEQESEKPAQNPEEESPEEPEEPERTVYPVLEPSGAEEGEALYEALSAGAATFLFSEETLATSDALARRLAAEGQTIALRIDASGGAEAALSRAAAANRALWSAANIKTRLVLLDNAAEDTWRTMEEAGYCPIRLTRSYSALAGGTREKLRRFLSAADANGGNASLLLNSGDSGILKTALASLQESNCTLLALNELSARRI